VSKQLYPILSPIITDHQHGFMSKRSTATNLLSFTEYITSVLDARSGQVDVIYTDFLKCFDKIHHNVLISKLEAIGIKGNLLNWLESFHKGRKQVVK
jgi:Reverse transcriptase (RNA-dependent DNA polymerase).